MTRSAVALSLLVLLASLLSACGGSDEAPAAPRSTPLTELDVTGVRLARAPFCDRLAQADVRAALGGPAESDDAWGNGDPIPADGSPGQVGHEFGCSWTGADGAVVAAWVYARPVSVEFATRIVRAAVRESCAARPVATFGSPAVVQTCPTPAGLDRVRHAGLFGDSWLTCEVTGPTSEAKARADRWCATTVSALDVS